MCFIFLFGGKLLLDSSLVHRKKQHHVQCVLHSAQTNLEMQQRRFGCSAHCAQSNCDLAGLVRDVRNIQDVNTPVFYMVYIHIKHLVF